MYGRGIVVMCVVVGCYHPRSIDVAANDATIDSGNDGRIVDARIIDGRIADARPDSGPDACVPSPRQLLLDSTLEATTSWTQSRNASIFPIIGVPPVAVGAVSGMNVAMLGGTNDAVDFLTQVVSVPSDATSVRLAFNYEVRTTEQAADVNPYDKLEISIRTESNAQIEVVQQYSNLDFGASYSSVSLALANNIAGQRIMVSFKSTNDSASPTTFYFDNIELNVTACR
jgi:hypothetical protein